jgi:uncharacterized glyoxalase superfamily protein PhnB
MSDEEPGVVPMLSYRDGPAAMDWLSRVFGFEIRQRWLDDQGVLTHGELSTGNGVIMLATPTRDYEGPSLHRSHCETATAWSSVPWVIDGVLVYVDDVAAHFDRSNREGADLLSGIEEGPNGSRLYRSEDIEGHRWMFMQRNS